MILLCVIEYVWIGIKLCVFEVKNFSDVFLFVEYLYESVMWWCKFVLNKGIIFL